MTQPFHPWFADKIPYVVAVIELVEEPGLKLVTNIVEHAGIDLRVDLPVEVTFLRLNDDFVIPVFRPQTAGRS